MNEPDGRESIDTRRFRWMIGGFGLALVAAISVYGLATRGVKSAGIPPGRALPYFAAPLAASTLNGDPNLNPPCTTAKHDPRALNVCLLVARAPLVLALFVPGSRECRRQVDAVQAVSGEFGSRAVSFAAVAVHAGHSQVAALVRAHRWTIPVAFDRDGSVGELYGVAICPMLELAGRGGVVQQRLLGGRWLDTAALAARVRALLAGGG
ncbi:MAG: redoxin domain-containing protein [Solirubrobacterales bacterium]|nr:redoxin domain-containing protein [Solirubrobacterales bacterium]MBV9471572.1 redoxin domain-containing protein [Solirubrobacterales bacterium]MBV9837309.1 redoxin domain-containing protein [Solirubrobacterales bacterium]